MLLETKVLGNEQVTKDVLKEINCRFPILNLNATKIFTLTYNEDFEKVTVNKTECNDVILTNDTEYWGCDDMDVKSEYDETIDVDTTEEVTINKTKHNDVVLTNDNNVDVKSQNDASINIDATEKNLDNDYFEEFLDSDNASEEDKLISGNSIEKNKKSKLKVTEEHGDVVATNDTLYLECKDTKNKSDESLSLDDANELICDDDFENFNNNDDDYSEEDKLKECFDNVDFEKNTNDDNELEEDELTSREHIKENKRSKPKISLILFSKKQQRTKIESDNDNNNESGINQKENDIDKLNNINKMVKIKTVPKKKLEKPKEKIGKSDTALEINELNVSKYNMTLKILTKEEQVEKMLAKKESEKYKNSRFKCKICYSVFMTETAFAMHNARHQPDTQRKSECKVCHVFVRKVKHRVHEREHAIEIVCTLCGLELLPSGIRIRTHHAFHQGNKFQCGQCDKSFSQHSTYVNHKRIKHGNTACGLCARVYFSDWGVTSHIRKSHRAEAPEQCNSCKHYFCNQEALQYHLGACSKSITPCAYCGLILPSATALGAHITSEHSKSKRAGCVCTDCQRPFSSEKNLKKHWIYMHQSGPNRKRRAQLAQKAKKTIPCQEGINSRKIKHKSCICEQCGAVLQSSSHLHIHMSVHTGEKAHRCEVCSRTFRLLNSLKQHQRVHTGEKPYKCSECSRTFRQGSHLRGHMRIHTGERPYHCEACSKTFALKANRDEHVRTVHEGQPPRRRRRVKNNRRKLNEYSDSD